MKHFFSEILSCFIMLLFVIFTFVGIGMLMNSFIYRWELALVVGAGVLVLYLWFRRRQLKFTLKRQFNLGLKTDELARRLGMSVADLEKFAPQYREFTIPKRRGGHRKIQAPDAATKDLQRRIAHRLLAKLKVHPCATAYRPGLSVAHNAKVHAGKAVVIKMDIVDFFSSTSRERVHRYFRRIGWNREPAEILTRLTTLDGGLPQGAPTSPLLSNLVNYALDEKLLRRAKHNKGHYTRYADDLTFSYPENWPRYMRGTVQVTRKVLKACGYRMHSGGEDKKTLSIRRQHQQQTVTGLVVNDHPQLPRKQRRKLRAVEHHLQTGRPASMTPEQLAGWRAYEAMIRKQLDS